MQFFLPEEVLPEGPMPDLVVGTRYKLYYKQSVDPNRYYFIGTYDGATPANYLKFRDVVYPNGSTAPSVDGVLPQSYTYMPAPAGGRRRATRRRSGSKRRGSRKSRSSRRNRRNRRNRHN